MLRFGAWILLFLSGCASSSAKATRLPAEATPDPADGIALVAVEHAEPLPADAPRIVVRGDVLFLDGHVVGDVGVVRRSKRIQRVDGLFHALKARRDAWVAAHPGSAPPERPVLFLDETEVTLVTKSVFQTAAFAGYGRPAFVVRGPDGKPGILPLLAQMPGPPREDQVNGRLAPEEIARVVRTGRDPLRTCLEQAWPKNDGQLTVRFVIGRDGHVTEATITTMFPRVHASEPCVLATFSSLIFPKPAGGIVTVVWPVVYTKSDPPP